MTGSLFPLTEAVSDRCPIMVEVARDTYIGCGLRVGHDGPHARCDDERSEACWHPSCPTPGPEAPFCTCTNYCVGQHKLYEQTCKERI